MELASNKYNPSLKAPNSAVQLHTKSRSTEEVD